jgi:hypothetical protein
MEVPLVAGRFAPLAGSFAFDLGTGERAYLMLESLHGRFAPPAWAERCAALSALWHPAMAECLDFGSLGEEHRFVAFRVVRQLAGLRTCASFERTRSQVDAFLAACGLDSRALNTPFNDGAERLVSVPAIEPENLQRSNVTRTIADAGRWFGVRLVQRSALQTVREYLDAGTTPGMRIQHVEAPRGSGGRTFLRWCAREARRCGYIPLGGAALHWILRQPMERADEWMAMLARHNIVLLHDGRERRFNEDLVLVRALLRLGTREARPSCIVLELTASGGPQGRLHLARLSERELIDMIVASDVSKREGQVIAGAARTSQGRPGPFIKRVATLFAGRSAEDPPAGYTVHERSLCYGASIDSRRVPEPPRPQPMRQDVTDSATVREIHTAMALRAKGRHAAADRALRHAEAAASRRGRWASAAMAAMSLARLRAERGEIVAA